MNAFSMAIRSIIFRQHAIKKIVGYTRAFSFSVTRDLSTCPVAQLPGDFEEFGRHSPLWHWEIGNCTELGEADHVEDDGLIRKHPNITRRRAHRQQSFWGKNWDGERREGSGFLCLTWLAYGLSSQRVRWLVHL